MLRGALADAGAGRGRTVILSGESGIGKTTLATAIADQGRQEGWTVAVGRASPVESGIPYAPLADALVPLLRTFDERSLSVLTRGAARELGYFFPVLAPPDSNAGDGEVTGSAERRARLLWNFSQFLGRLATRRPVLLILENLQWADASTLELFHFVARQLRDQRLFLLATYNDTERDVNPTLRATEQSLLSLGAAARCPVPPLDRTAVAQLVRHGLALDDESASSLSALLHERTRGNPFFLRETLDALSAARASGAIEDPWGDDAPELPRSIREALATRLAALSPTARAVAEHAAVIGTRASYDILRAVCVLPPDQLVPALDELRAARVLAERDEGSVVYDFVHPMMREAAYLDLGRARAGLLHARVAECLEHHYGADAGKHAAELGFHYARAASRDLAPKTLRHLIVAGREALSRGADREAATAFGAALEIVEGTSDGAAAPTDLLSDLARARQRLGELEEAHHLWVRAADAAAARGDLRGVAAAERHLGLVAFWRGRSDEALHHYDRGIDAARQAGEQALLVRLEIARGAALQAVGKLAEGRDALERALGLAERAGKHHLLSRAHRALLLHFLWAAEPEQARMHARETLALAERAAEPLLAWSAHWALGVLAGLTGNAPQLAKHLAECDRLVEAMHSPILRLWTSELEIHYRYALGEWDQALRVGERAIALAHALQHRALLPRILVWTGIIYLGRGDLERGKRCLDEAWEIAGGGAGGVATDQLTTVQLYTGLTTYHNARGEWSEAVRAGEAGLALADRSGNVVWAVYRLIPALIESCLRVVDLQRAEALGARLRRDSERLGHRLGIAWADACEALVAPLRGETERSVGLLAHAVASLDAVPFVPDAARLRRELARRKAQSGERESALRDLREAHEMLARLGAEPELEGAREQMRELGGRLPARTRTAGAAGLTGRELEIVRLVTRRKSNKEIARTLGISPRTVSTHLSNVFAKLDVNSRGELTDYARSAGIDSDSPPAGG